jgi:K+-dependent Na+/Ca+ exchanger-like protein
MLGMLIIYGLILLIAFYLLAKICDNHFVGSLETIAHKMRLNDDVAWATLMAVGSSAPEFFTALIAIFTVWWESIWTGTIIGSALFNLLIIIGWSAIVGAYVQKAPLQKQWFLRDMWFYALAIIILYITFIDGSISRWEAWIYVALYLIYVILLWHWSERFPDRDHANRDHANRKHHTEHDHADSDQTDDNTKTTPLVHSNKTWLNSIQPSFRTLRDKCVTTIDNAVGRRFPDANNDNGKERYMQVFFTSIIGIGLISWILVLVAQQIAVLIGVPPVLVALTIIAWGTSIPDTISSIIVAKKWLMDMAVSNAVWSNTFNIFVCLWFPWLIYTLYSGQSMIVETKGLVPSILLLLWSVITITWLVAWSWFRLRYWHGIFFIGLYLSYIIFEVLTAV